jgi:phenylpyruvate tautomerase PptA (4-oxalocrotonate tautomerase family)
MASKLLTKETTVHKNKQGHTFSIHKKVREKAIMTTKGKIKVIKKNEIREASPVVNTESVEKKSNRESARVMVSTVTNWVSDFQNRKREETKIAIEKFFTPQTQVGEV